MPTPHSHHATPHSIKTNMEQKVKRGWRQVLALTPDSSDHDVACAQKRLDALTQLVQANKAMFQSRTKMLNRLHEAKTTLARLRPAPPALPPLARYTPPLPSHLPSPRVNPTAPSSFLPRQPSAPSSTTASQDGSEGLVAGAVRHLVAEFSNFMGSERLVQIAQLMADSSNATVFMALQLDKTYQKIWLTQRSVELDKIYLPPLQPTSK